MWYIVFLRSGEREIEIEKTASIRLLRQKKKFVEKKKVSKPAV